MKKETTTSERKHRCRGTVVREIHGQFKNTSCAAEATERREVPGSTPAKKLRFCAKCAADWDQMQAQLSVLL